MEYNKIYARANENGIVTYVFSGAFEDPIDGDICIDEVNTDRHGARAYHVVDENGLFNYRIVNGEMVERDKTADLQKERNHARIGELKALLRATDYKTIKYTEGELSEEEFAETKAQRKAWRVEINRLEADNI